MPRKIRFGRGVVIVPASLVEGAEREVEADDPHVFVVYPPGTDGPTVLKMIEAAAALAKAADALEDTDG